MTIDAMRQRIGLLGGSFDPIHVGHLALGRAAAVALRLDRMLVIPTGHSYQKLNRQQTSAEHRLAMTRLAVDALHAEIGVGAPAPTAEAPVGAPGGIATQATGACRWEVDDIEVRRDGPSYTVDTLAALRARVGPGPALILILGSDQLHNLATWHRWRDLLTFAHIAATQREHVSLADLPPAIDALLTRHGADALPDTPAGTIVLFRMPAVAVSATALRRGLANDRPVDALLPTAVADYARSHGLYAALRSDSQ